MKGLDLDMQLIHIAVIIELFCQRIICSLLVVDFPLLNISGIMTCWTAKYEKHLKHTKEQNNEYIVKIAY